MKRKAILFTLLVVMCQMTYAQNDTIWRTGGLLSVNFNQVSLSNWAGGGENSLALNGLANLFAKYKKGKVAWDNNLDLGYGIVKQGEEKIRRQIASKYDISTLDLVTIIENAGYRLRNNR